MVLLGLLLVVVAAAVLVQASLTEQATTTAVKVLDWTFNLTAFELFLAGAATSAAFLLGLALVSAGLRRGTLRRRRVRDERLAERDRVSRLESEKRDLERRLDSAEPTRPEPRVDPAEPTQPAEPVRPEPSDQLVAGRHANRPAD
ncbi:hypothetical protein [Acrocarpospora catenulata]|uniref:hypothetical protein n=1 Tax=Acrocarpospora catenulata TaxID=2836182 RepID=UPI001BD9609A|nr:hypothetical protein [Acrocarpospora catenulata]